MSLLRRAPVRRENLLHDFALQAVRETSAGLRQEAGNLTIDFASALGLERFCQTASQSLELSANAVSDWRRAIAAQAEIFAVRSVGHRTISSLTMTSYEICSSAIFEQPTSSQENRGLTKDVVSAYG